MVTQDLGAGLGAGVRAVMLRSVLLSRVGVAHGFSTRLGGVSSGVFSSLNFGNPGDLAPDRRDSPANIRENQRRALRAIGCERREVVEVWQVHGSAVHVRRLGEARAASGPAAAGSEIKADAIVSDDAGCVVGVRVADCAPILLSSSDGRIVAAVHAGWRGMIEGVLPAAVRTMQELGARGIVAAIGPCISVDAFEVGDEVAAEFDRVFGARASSGVVRRQAGAKAHVDLKLALRLQLLREELGADEVETLPHCTVRDRALFFSHRRDGGVTGRMLAMIGAIA